MLEVLPEFLNKILVYVSMSLFRLNFTRGVVRVIVRNKFSPRLNSF